MKKSGQEQSKRLSQLWLLHRHVGCYLSWHGFLSYRAKSGLIYGTPVCEANFLVNRPQWLLDSESKSKSAKLAAL